MQFKSGDVVEVAKSNKDMEDAGFNVGVRATVVGTQGDGTYVEVADKGGRSWWWSPGCFTLACSVPSASVPASANPKERFGQTKPSVGLIPASALLLEAGAFEDGAAKYGAYNWRKNPVSAMTYIHAATRHLLCYTDGERCAEDSGRHHLAHARACLGILLDAEACDTLVDDRPLPGKASATVKALTKKVQP